jgi:hypothetical protein
MQNAFDEVNRAMAEARDVTDALRTNALSMASLLLAPGVLQAVPEWKLKQLKKALFRFNAHTGRWKE